MARKPDVRYVHPGTIMQALPAMMNDVLFLRSTVSNALRFMDDRTMDAEKVRSAVTPQLKEALERLDKWYDAE